MIGSNPTSQIFVLNSDSTRVETLDDLFADEAAYMLVNQNGESYPTSITPGAGSFRILKVVQGKLIESPLVTARELDTVNVRSYEPTQNQILQIKNYTGKCDTDYVIKVEFTNSAILQDYSNHRFTDNLSFRTDCCEGCPPDTCAGEANEVTLKILENSEGRDYFTAKAIARQDITAVDVAGISADLSAGDDMTEAEVQALIDFNANQADEADKLYSDIEIEIFSIEATEFCGINVNYLYPRLTTVNVVLKYGMKCDGEVVETQEGRVSMGESHDVKYDEYIRQGYMGQGDLRVSSITNLPNLESTKYQAVTGNKYGRIIFNLTKDGAINNGRNIAQNSKEIVIYAVEASSVLDTIAGELTDITGIAEIDAAVTAQAGTESTNQEEGEFADAGDGDITHPE